MVNAKMDTTMPVAASQTLLGAIAGDSDIVLALAIALIASKYPIAYVGDRLDNDIVPAADFGMTAVFIERGPWGLLHAHSPNAARANAHIQSLSELLPLLK